MTEFLEKLVAFLKDWGGLIVATLSLIVACISFFKSSKAQKIQNQVAELDSKIKQYELDKIEQAKAEENFSCVKARVVKIGKNYRLKIWNAGNTTVYNVSAEIEDGASVFMIKSKMPYEELEPQNGFEEVLVTHSGTSPKFKITTKWEDHQHKSCERTQIGDI